MHARKLAIAAVGGRPARLTERRLQGPGSRPCGVFGAECRSPGCHAARTAGVSFLHPPPLPLRRPHAAAEFDPCAPDNLAPVQLPGVGAGFLAAFGMMTALRTTGEAKLPKSVTNPEASLNRLASASLRLPPRGCTPMLLLLHCMLGQHQSLPPASNVSLTRASP